MKSSDILLAFLPPFLWGASFTIAKAAVAQFPPLFMMLMIYASIAVVLGLAWKDPIRTPWKSLLLIAAFVVPIQGVFLFLGLRGLSASVANLILQIQVPLAVMVGWIAGDAFSSRKFAGTLVALAGVVMVIGLPAEKPPLVPALLVIAGALFWAIGQVLAAKLGRDSGMTQLKGVAIAGTPQLILATLLFESGQIEAVQTATGWDWLALAIVGFAGFFCAYAVWFTLLRRVSMDEAAPFTLLMPVYGIATAALLFGERLSFAHFAGGGVILLGLLLITGGFRLPKGAKPADT
ncbi:MAG: DMT family transporter [Aestuariivirga sp.]